MPSLVGSEMCIRDRYHIKDALDNHEQTGGGACCKRPRQRGTDASFTCMLLRSCRDVRRPRHLPIAKTAISQPDPDGTTKKQISYFGDPQTGEVSYYHIKLKKQEKNMIFCISTSMPAEYWYVPRVSYVQKFHPTRSLFILTWGGVWCRFLVLLSTPA